MIEMGGQLIGQGLSKPVSFRGTRGCSFDDPNCWVDPEEHCSDSRVIYEVRCLNCQGEKTAKYIGTSGFTSHKRTREHQSDVRNRRLHNSIYKHHAQTHSNDDPRFTTKTLRKGIRFTMDRYITEALLIEENHQDPNVDLLNNRSEWGHRGVPRVRFDN